MESKYQENDIEEKEEDNEQSSFFKYIESLREVKINCLLYEIYQRTPIKERKEKLEKRIRNCWYISKEERKELLNTLKEREESDNKKFCKLL